MPVRLRSTFAASLRQAWALWLVGALGLLFVAYLSMPGDAAALAFLLLVMGASLLSARFLALPLARLFASVPRHQARREGRTVLVLLPERARRLAPSQGRLALHAFSLAGWAVAIGIALTEAQLLLGGAPPPERALGLGPAIRRVVAAITYAFVATPLWAAATLPGLSGARQLDPVTGTTDPLEAWAPLRFAGPATAIVLLWGVSADAAFDADVVFLMRMVYVALAFAFLLPLAAILVVAYVHFMAPRHVDRFVERLGALAVERVPPPAPQAPDATAAPPPSEAQPAVPTPTEPAR